MADAEIVEVGRYLDMIGWGKYTTITFLQCGMVKTIQGWASMQMWSVTMGFLLVGIGDEWGLQ